MKQTGDRRPHLDVQNREMPFRKRTSLAGENFPVHRVHYVSKPAVSRIGVQLGMPHGGNRDFRCIHGKLEQSQARYLYGITGKIRET